jgi:heat shock protein beta
MIKVMSKKLVRKAIEMIKGIAAADEEDEENEDEYADEAETTKEEESTEEESEDEEEEDKEKGETKYEKFWKSFGKNLKLGVIEDPPNRTKLAKLLRFASTYDPLGLVSLDDYMSRMQDNQDTIYFLPGDSLDAIQKSPLLKKYKEADIEVLLMPDPIDEFCMQHLSEYERKKVKSIAKDDANPFDKDSREKKKQ